MSFQLLKKFKATHWYSFFWKSLVFLGFAFMIGFFRTYHLPKIKNWLLIEVEKQSQKHSPFRVWPQSVDVKLFPPGVKFNDVRVLPQGEMASNIGPIHLDSFEVSISVLGLIQGNLRASRILVENPEFNFIFKQSLAELLESGGDDAKKPTLELEQIFRLPIDEIALENIKILAKFNNENLALRLRDASLSAENKYKSLLLKVDFPEITIKQLGDKPDTSFALSTKTLIEKTGVQISSFQLKANSSFIVASGKVEGDIEKLNLSTANLNSRALFQLNELYDLLPVFSSKVTLPSMGGSIGADTKMNYNFTDSTVTGEFSLESKDLEIQDRLIGNVRSQGQFQKEALSTPLITIKNRTGSAEIKDFAIQSKEGKIDLGGTLKVHHLSVRPFLNSIGVGLIPVETQLSGELPCKGSLTPEVKVNCSGVATSKNLHIYSDKKTDTIVKVPFMEANGTVTITDQSVSYDAKLKAGNKSRGSSKGSISYKKGFNISFIGERVEMSDIEDLVGLKIEGAAALSGTTTGTSKWGTVEIDTRAKKLWLEDYGLGSVDSIIRYKDGKLTFSKIKGQFNSSRYEGSLAIDVQKKELFLTQKLAFIELFDVQKIFSRKVQLPIKINGTGTGQLKAWGPLQFNKMSYTLKSSFYRGEVAKETFDKAVFNVEADKGNVRATEVRVTKADSTIDLNGIIDPSGKIDAVVVGRQLRLEQSENLAKAGLDIAGQFDSTLLLKGQLPDPEIVLNGRLRRLVIGSSPADDSSFQLNIMKDRLKGNVSFIGKTLQSSFVFPYDDNGPFELKLKTTDWDFTSLFTVFSSTAKKKDFVTKLTSDINLSAHKGGFWNSTGSVNIENFLIQRGPLSMTSASPMSLKFRDGNINSNDIYLRGEGTFLKVDILNANKNNLNSDINGKLDLSLVALVTPFLDDLRGRLSLAIKTQGPINNPNAVGSAFIEDGYLKLGGFPHPFDQISADLLFNQKSIIVNAMKASLGGGPIKGEGRIVVNSMSDVPVDVRASFDDISLNLPDGMRTKGSGQIQFVGNRFPYLLKGQYNVTYGDITMDFTNNKTKANEIKPSEFLPKFLTEDAFQPVRLDLEIDVTRPIAVRNELIDAQAKGKISVKGTPDSLKLNGIVNPIPGGILKFKDTEFEITSGYVDFRNSNPENPIIYLTAESKVTETTINPTSKREESTDYEVGLLVQGQAPNIKINLESQPPLTYQQIVSLLALGITTTTSLDQSYNPDSQSSSDDALASGVIGTQLGTQLIGQGISEPLKERLGVEIKISTSQSTVDNATYPKVIFSKQWTPKWETSASRTIENNPKSDVKFEYKLNENISYIGLWEGREQTSTDTDQQEEENKIGVDVEYKVNFK